MHPPPTDSPRPPGSSARRPCDTCGTPVDPLRAPFVAHIDGAFRYYCSRECHARRAIAPAHPPTVSTAVPATVELEPARPTPVPPLALVPERPSIEQVADMLGLTRASLPDDLRGGAPGSPGDPAAQPGEGRVPERPATTPTVDRVAPAVALACAALAWLLDAVGGPPGPVRTALVGAPAVAGIALAGREAWRMRRAGGGLLAWVAPLLGPVALFLLAVRGAGSVARASRLADAAVLAAVVPVVAWLVRVRVQRAQRALAALADDLPRTARVLRAGGEVEAIEASRVRAGEEVAVEAGEAVPADGVVRAGHGLAVLHPRGGEARPFAEGDALIAGARVVEGSARVLATRAGDDAALARLARQAVAGAELPRVMRFLERVTPGLPLVVGGVAAAGGLAHALGGGGDPVGVAAVALAAAPCALGAALARVPFVDAMARAAARGIVFRDPPSVEAAATVGTVMLCVRGTVTAGRLELVDVVSLGARSEREIIAVAAAAEEVARDHPIARAVAEVARRRGLAVESVRRPARVPGRGITAVTAAGEGVAIGSRELLLSEGVSVAPAEDVARAIEVQRRTAVFVAIAGRVEGVFGLDDPLRDEARPAVQAMMDAGFDLGLLGGESRGTLEAIGLALDVTNVRPEVSPDERAAAVRAIAEVANGVAVVGRAARDGAALGAADVAISLAAAGAAGGETAVALASDDLRDAAAALALARQGRDRAMRVATLALAGAVFATALHAFVPAFGAWGTLATAVGLAVVACLTSER